MPKANIYRVYCNGELMGEGSSGEWAEELHFDRYYITRMARYGMPLGSADGKKKYVFEIVGVYDGASTVYYKEPLKSKPQPEKKKPKKNMTITDVLREGAKVGLDYGYMSARLEGRI